MRVNFLIVGAQKSGTTALATFLAQVPEVCMAPVKEVHYFDDEAHFHSAPDPAAYHAHFPTYAGEPLVGEATPIYMYWPHVAPRIRDYNPAMKLIVLLRDPVERAHAHWRMIRRVNGEPLPFGLALAAEPFRLWRGRGDRSMDAPSRHFSYTDRGFYTRQLTTLRAHFPEAQLLVLTSRELAERHDETLARVSGFLGVPFSHVPPPARHNAGPPDAPMSPLARAYLSWRFRRERRALGRLAAPSVG